LRSTPPASRVDHKGRRLHRLLLCVALLLAGCQGKGGNEPAAQSPSPSPVVAAAARPTPIGIVPKHVMTYQFFGVNGVPKGYPHVKTQVAGRWVTWAMSSPRLASALSAAGMVVVYYTDPNRVAPRDKEYSNDERQFAHDCGGRRIRVNKGEERYLTDPSSPVTLERWKAELAEAMDHGGYDIVFDDTAGTTNSLSALPCGFEESRWLAQHAALIGGVTDPVLVNGLGDGNLPLHGRGASAEYEMSPIVQIVAQAKNAIGGAFEDCYASPSHASNKGGKVTAGSYWRQTENTELALARMHKIFVCNERAERLSMDDAIDARMFSEASFLLTYDIGTTMVRQQFVTPSQLNLGPEIELVALDPVAPAPQSIDDLKTSTGAYGREYRACYIAGTPVGPCAAAVNPDKDGPHAFPFAGYARTMVLQGSGVEDGGLMDMSGPAPTSIAPLQGVVAFK
jgi:hypothetical protein